jgi:adenine/guanine phosphoribosyltransferase-like PRPP-binding protein
MDPAEAGRRALQLLERIDMTEIDLVVGIPEGGIIPAYAVAAAAGLPLALATRTVIDQVPAVTFVEPHVTDQPPFSLYGIAPGTRVLIVEDEVTTGRTAVNVVTALRGAGVDVRGLGAFLLVDHPETRERLDAAGISIVACVELDRTYLDRVRADGI